MDRTGLFVGLAAAAVGLIVGLLGPVITYRYMWKMDHGRWVRERRTDAYVRMTTQVLHYAQAVADYTQAVADLPDDVPDDKVPDIGRYLRDRSPYTDPYGQETGQLIIAFGTPDMVRLMLGFGDIQRDLDKLGKKRDQVPSLLRRLEQIQAEMDHVVKRDIQGNEVTAGSVKAAGPPRSRFRRVISRWSG